MALVLVEGIVFIPGFVLLRLWKAVLFSLPSVSRSWSLLEVPGRGVCLYTGFLPWRNPNEDSVCSFFLPNEACSRSSSSSCSRRRRSSCRMTSLLGYSKLHWRWNMAQRSLIWTLLISSINWRFNETKVKMKTRMKRRRKEKAAKNN